MYGVDWFGQRIRITVCKTARYWAHAAHFMSSKPISMHKLFIYSLPFLLLLLSEFDLAGSTPSTAYVLLLNINVYLHPKIIPHNSFSEYNQCASRVQIRYATAHRQRVHICELNCGIHMKINNQLLGSSLYTAEITKVPDREWIPANSSGLTFSLSLSFQI